MALTQDQLDAQNKQNGTSQYNSGPAASGVSISSADLAPVPSADFTSPQTPPVYPVSTLTQPEKTAQNLTNDIQGLNTKIAGKAADTTDLYKQQGYNVSQDGNGNLVVNDPGMSDLNTQLTRLTNEANAIPLQLQNDATGRGITAGGLQPIQTAALRNNAIEALSVNSLISAKNNQLGNAQKLVEAALFQKYGPLEAELKSKLANLDIIQKSPEYSAADKARAAQQASVVAQQTAALDLQKTNETNAQAEVLKYANVATTNVLQEMQKAKSAPEVAAIAAKYGIQQPQAGRYQKQVSTLTDAFGNQYQVERTFDTVTGKYVDGGTGGGAPSSSSPAGGGDGGGPAPAPISGTKLSFDQYGLLSKTDYNPNSTTDSLASKYLDSYIKNGTVPTASTLGRSIKPAAMAQIVQRAQDLYFGATGQSLPNPEVIKGYQAQLIGNNKLLNNLNVQEGTIGKNAQLLLNNLTASNLNDNIPAINGVIDNVRNMLGDPAVAQFLAQNTTVSNELGSLLSLKNAQGTTVHDKLEAAGLISRNDNQAQITAKIKVLLQEAVNAHDAITSANTELYKQTDPLLQDANNPGRLQAQNQSFIDQSLSAQGLHYDSLVSEMQAQTQAGHQPALDRATGLPVFATPEEIKSGKYVPL